METIAPVTSPPTTPVLPKPPQHIVHWVIGLSLCLGIVGDGLLRVTPWGINASIFVGLVGLGIAWAWQRHQESGPCWDLLTLVGVFGLCLAWHDSPALNRLNLMTVIVLLLVLGTRPTHRQLYAGTLTSVWANTARGVGHAMASPLLLLAHDIDWALASLPLSRTQKRLLRALIMALPILLVFACLFSAADAVFQHGIETVGHHMYDFFVNEELVMHLLFSLLFFNLAVMVLRPITLRDQFKPCYTAPPHAWVPGEIELSVVMGSTLLLFLAFILIQFRYLFGGHHLVQAITGLTYATYARRGFFALLAVVLLVHLVLIIGAWLVEHANTLTQSLFRWLSLGLIFLTAFVFASAVFRLSIYIETYGLTQLRFYAMAILMWLGLVLLLSLAKCLLPCWSHFTGAYVYSFLAILLLVNVINPDGTIARINLDRFVAQGKLDRSYLGALSTDAVPVILHYQEQLSPEDSSALLDHIIGSRNAYKTDWRCWNYSRAQARRIRGVGSTSLEGNPDSIPLTPLFME